MTKVTIDHFLSSASDGVFYVGHASIIARLSGKNFLFDFVRNNEPYGNAWKFFPALAKDIDFNKIDGVFVSHVHQDHYDVDFLRDIQKKCPIFIIGGRESFESSLRKEQIEFTIIPPNQKCKIGEDIVVFGVLHDSNGVDASCYIGNKHFSVYHGNDNYTSNETLRQISDEFGFVDVACIPYAYINWYPQLLENLTAEEKQAESDRLVKQYFEYAIEQRDVLKAKQVIPFGANLVYFDTARSPLNLECKSPLDFEHYVRETRGAEEAKNFKALFTGDIIFKIDNELELHAYSSFDKETFRDAMDEFLSSLPKGGSDEDSGKTEAPLGQFTIRNKTESDHIVAVRKDHSDECVAINTCSGDVSIKNVSHLKAPFHMVTIESDQLFRKWKSREISLEEIIGTRKFRISRSPNVYDKRVLLVMTTEL